MVRKLLFILIFGIGTAIALSPPGKPVATGSPTGDSGDARVMASQFIDAEMAPLVVKHGWGLEVNYNASSKCWVARGSITTHNGTITRDYKLTLSTTDGKSWRVEELIWLS